MQSAVNKAAFKLTVEQVQVYKICLFCYIFEVLQGEAWPSLQTVLQGWCLRDWFAPFGAIEGFAEHASPTETAQIWCLDLPGPCRQHAQTVLGYDSEGLHRREGCSKLAVLCQHTAQSCTGSHSICDHSCLQPSILLKFPHREFSPHPLSWVIKHMCHEVAPDACRC